MSLGCLEVGVSDRKRFLRFVVKFMADCNKFSSPLGDLRT